jgi:hypothetical protein
MTGPESLVIFDYSGTLSLEAPLFGRPENLVRALADSGLATVGIAAPEDFWRKIVNPTWTKGSTTGIGYKRLLTERIADLGLVPGISPTEIAAAASCFVDGYLSHSRIDPRWKGTLTRLGEDPSVLTMIATDHYAEATATITGDLRSLASRIFVANSADIGCWKGDSRFWERIKQRLPVAEVRQVLIVDDFGSNEARGDDYGGEPEVLARQAMTLANLRKVFPGNVEAIPFFLKGSPSDREAAAARLIAETTARIDAFLGRR